LERDQWRSRFEEGLFLSADKRETAWKQGIDIQIVRRERLKRETMLPTPVEEPPVQYIGRTQADPRYHDGRLRPVVGVANYQVMRCNRSHPERNEGFGWTYNHAPNLAYWNGTFYFHYLGNLKDEHFPPGQTFLVTSKDGRNWGRPQVLFPVYYLSDGKPAMMHQRMGFYVAPNGRLLALGFIGVFPDPVDGTGIGRVVREIYKDGSFGPIYFLRYNSHRGWNEKNTSLPFYTTSTDEEFKAACNALLADKLMTAQWWDEEQSTDGFFSRPPGYEALSYYHRKDGKVVGLFKWSYATLSEDEGKTWTKVWRIPSLIMDGAKIWGQRTKDGRYALVYNPNRDGEHRWPLAVVTGEDGKTFTEQLCVHGEVPPRRFAGHWKDFGPQYNRGIEEGNGEPPGNTMWISYSMNKEDMWISRIPLPIRSRVDAPVDDSFEAMEPGGHVTDWNIYSPKWASVQVVDLAEGPGKTNRCLELRDEEPHDYARAIRVFPESRVVTLRLRVRPEQTQNGRLEIDVTDARGLRPARLALTAEGVLTAENGRKRENLGTYAAKTWLDLELDVDTRSRRYTVRLGGKTVLENAAFAERVETVERLSLRTGPYREYPYLTTKNETDDDVANPDDPEPLAVYYVDDVKVTPQVRANVAAKPR
jgi:hypothetical protein